MKYVIAIDIGGTNTRTSLMDEKLNILNKSVINTQNNSENAFINSIIDSILSLNIDLNNVKAIGIGVPGEVNLETFKVKQLVNINKSFQNIDIKKRLEDKFNIPVFIRNDAQMACYAEANIGHGKNHDRCFFITISTGLGGSLCINKEIQDYVTEIGHTAYFYKDYFYSYETLISGSGILNLAKINNLNIVNSSHFFKLLGEGNEQSLNIFKDWQKILNDFIRLVIDSYNPDIIVVTGGLMKSSNYFFNSLIESFPIINIKECKLKEDAGIIGAGLYAFLHSKT